MSIDSTHVFTTVESTDTTVTRECSCGWATTGTVPEPDWHTPLARREADHVAKAAKIADGTVWDEIPERRYYRLHLRRRMRDQARNHVVVTADWGSGSREVLIWPWTAEGLAEAQKWCDEHPTCWTTGHPVGPGSLARHADA